MPAITLFVCVFGDRVPLSRLIERSKGCYDELLVVHDIPDEQDVESLVRAHGGRFLTRPRAFSQEPHFPFAFEQASHDWILKLDSDEYPSAGLRDWLIRFRHEPEPPGDPAGYQCIWPVWNGRKPLTKRWPNNRIFLYRRDRVRFIGVCEQGPIPDKPYKKIPFVLCHEPATASHGLKNIFGKNRSVQGRGRLVQALLSSPLAHPRWRYTEDRWPPIWEEIVRHPLRTMLRRLLFWPIRQGGAMLLAREWPRPSIFMHSAIFHALICLGVWKAQRQAARTDQPDTGRPDPAKPAAAIDAPRSSKGVNA